MNSYQQESEQARDWHRAEAEFVKFMNKARQGMTTDEDVEKAWELLRSILRAEYERTS